jgi:hypothetical protein
MKPTYDVEYWDPTANTGSGGWITDPWITVSETDHSASQYATTGTLLFCDAD